MKEISNKNKLIFGGYRLGALVMKSWVPKPVGHISCSANYDFPIYYMPVENTSNKEVHSGDARIIPDIIGSIHKMENMGCQSIISSCGYFGHYQKEVAKESNVPVYMSAVCLVPLIFRTLKDNQKLGIICYNKAKFTSHLFDSCSVSPTLQQRCIIADVVNEPELGNIIKDQGHYDVTKGREEVVGVARRLKESDPDIAAILLECTDLPPHSFAIQQELGVPVFDSTTMVKFVGDILTTGRSGGV